MKIINNTAFDKGKYYFICLANHSHIIRVLIFAESSKNSQVIIIYIDIYETTCLINPQFAKWKCVVIHIIGIASMTSEKIVNRSCFAKNTTIVFY